MFRNKMSRSIRSSAFTLTEMLVVLGIILVVMSMVLAGGVAARKAARQTMCLTHLRDIGVAVTNYSSRYDGAIPLGSWADFAPGGGLPTESPLSVRGFGSLPGDPKEIYGPGSGPLPTVRDVLLSFLNTKEPIWKCPLQLEARGATLLPFVGSGWADDVRGFRPGYRFMATLDMRALLRSTDISAQSLATQLHAADLLVRNVGGLKFNRVRTIDRATHSQVVLAYDTSVTFHSKETRELFEIPIPERVSLLHVNMVYLDGHAEPREFRDHVGFLKLFHGPVKQKWYGSDFETDYPDKFASSTTEPAK